MKIALCYLSNELPGFYGMIDRFQHRASLGLMYLASSVRNAGYTPELIDQRIERFDEDTWTRRIISGQFDAVGIYSFANTRRHHAEYIRRLRQEYSGTIIVGGPDGRKGAEYYLSAGADVVAVGEAEHLLPELLDRLKSGQSPAGLPGTVVLGTDAKVNRAPERPLLTSAQIEALPFPDWRPIDTQNYYDALCVNYRTPIASVMTARGCPFRCAFCGSPDHFPQVRQRSVANVLEEIDDLVERLGVRYILFHDDIFGVHADWALEFAARLQERPYQINWLAIIHPLAYGRRRAQVYAEMARAGLDFISFGAQSIDADVLRNINRNPAEARALRENVETCRQLGIATVLTYIFGLPGDTPDHVRRTIDYVLDVKPTLADFHPLYYIEGTPLADQYPDHDGNAYSYEDHKRWCRQARIRFYTNPRIAWQLVRYVARHNPRYFLKLAQIATFALPHYVFESIRPVRWESGDFRTDTAEDMALTEAARALR